MLSYLLQLKNKIELSFKKEFKAGDNIKWIGNSYGGFFVDTSLLNKNAIIVSVGIGEDISFDLGINELGIKKIFMFDPTPKAKIFFDAQKLPGQFSFFEMALSATDTEIEMYLPKNKSYVSGSLVQNKNVDLHDSIKVRAVTVSTICELIGEKKIDVLKMDIEGSEYEVLAGMLDSRIFPKQICVEFHNRFFKDGKKKFRDIAAKLLENQYQVKGISKTNEEFLFVHNS